MVNRAFNGIAILGVLLAATSCQPIAGPVRVEVVELADASGDYSLTDVTLQSVTDLRTGTGTLFDVLGAPSVSAQQLLDVNDRSKYPDLAALIAGERESAGGETLVPNMHLDGDTWIPEDFDTLLYFTTFNNFEKAWAFYDEVVGDQSGATQDHSFVGLYGQVAALDLLPVPILTSDNAAYVAPVDGWLTFRIFTQQGVPLAMNAPVLVHEFGHRHLFQNTFSGDAQNVWRDWLSNLEPSADLVRSGQIFKGLDEGLADLYAVGFSRDVNFLATSFAEVPTLLDQRNLEGPFADAATYDSLSASDLPDDLQGLCGRSTGSDLYEQSGFNFYCLGTIFDRAIWDATGRDFEVLRGTVLPDIDHALIALGALFAERGEMRFDADDLIQLVVEEIRSDTDAPSTLADALCSEFFGRFTSIMTPERVPACF